jgi:hypothetical protein
VFLVAIAYLFTPLATITIITDLPQTPDDANTNIIENNKIAVKNS